MKSFSHVSNFPGYMHRVRDILQSKGKVGQRVLDMPAGSGKFGDSLKELGFKMTYGDINQERNEFIYTNMEQPLPFADNSFDWVICMEGIEHVLHPAKLVEELCRITAPGGRVIITTPNVHNFYCRLMFLFTGILNLFEPENTQHPKGKMVDRGHISPMHYPTMCYFFEESGLKPEMVTGDKYKKKIYLPLYALLALINRYKLWRYQAREPNVLAYQHMAGNDFLMSRSLIGVWQKAL